MKTIASTKISGCTKTGKGTGWSLFVHEWGTTNRQLRLSWTDSHSACNELFSDRILVPFDRWVLVGFSLSTARNSARLYIDRKLAADTSKGGSGRFARQGNERQLEDAAQSAGERIVDSTSTFVLGAHTPQEGDGDRAQSHCFLGHIADVRLFHAAFADPQDEISALSDKAEAVLTSGTVSASAMAVQLQPAPGAKSLENLVNAARFSHTFQRFMIDPWLEKQEMHTPGKAAVWDKKHKHRSAGGDRDDPGSGGRSEPDPAVPLIPDQPGATLAPDELKQTWPDFWTAKFGERELRDSQAQADGWADQAREMMRHSWRGYKQKGWGRDEIHPDSGNTKDWCSLAVTMIDALSTLWLMGLTAEFDEAEEWLRKNPLPGNKKHGLNSLFETTIRALGGLLSAYSLSGRKIFLENAQRIGDKMMGAFDTKNGLPMSQIDVGTGKAGWHSWVNSAILSEVGTLQVEFRFLSHATGDPKYGKAADRAFDGVMRVSNGAGLVPNYLSKGGNSITASGSKISFGAMGDSYYEYLLKLWLQTGKREDKFKNEWKLAMRAMLEKMTRKTNGGLTYIAEMEGGRLRHRMDHLACFVSGMLVMGARTLPEAEVDPRWEETAVELARTCYEMYRRSPTGLSPEYVVFKPDQGGESDMSTPGDAPHNLLRPEAAEALYYMHYYTGDPKYRRQAHSMMQAFEKNCKAKFGYTSVRDVRQNPPKHSDSQESFWLAETLKYLFLIFAPRSALSLEEFVLNTEAHPMRVWV